MTWVRRTPDPATVHQCGPPMHEVTFRPPSATVSRWPEEAPPPAMTRTLVDGQPGDLWRCDTCRKLWRVVTAGGAQGGVFVAVHQKWMPATWWQRRRYRKSGDTRTRGYQDLVDYLTEPASEGMNAGTPQHVKFEGRSDPDA